MQDWLVNQGGRSEAAKNRIRERSIRLYNYLNAVKESLGKGTTRQKWLSESHILKEFKECSSYKKKFTGFEKKKLANLECFFSNLKNEEISPEESKDHAASLDLLMKRCDNVIEKY